MNARRMLVSFWAIIAVLFASLMIATNPSGETNSGEQVLAPSDNTISRVSRHLEPTAAAVKDDLNEMDEDEPLLTINEPVDWLTVPDDLDPDLDAIEESIESYYTLLINSFACGEIIEEIDMIDREAIQMQNLERYLANKMLFLDVMNRHGIDEHYNWHKPLVTVESHVFDADTAEVWIDLSLTNMAEDEQLPEIILPGRNCFYLKKAMGTWRIYGIEPDVSLGTDHVLHSEQLIELWTEKQVEEMLAALYTNKTEELGEQQQ